MIEHWALNQTMMPALAALVLVKLLIVAAVFLPLASVVAMFFIWWERKVAGHAQSRVGPVHVGGWHGWAQSIADGVKLILKEDLVPRDADGFLFRLAPYLAFAPVFAAFIAVPFGPQFTFEAALNIGVLYVLAVLAVEVMSTILAGWSSNSKWSVYGAMREACQMVSYEIPLGMSILTGVIVAGTLSLPELGYLQGHGVHDWFIFHNPFMAAAFLIYFIAATASSKRAPFDLPESESELVAGYLTEYSGLRWSLFFFAEYCGMFIIGAIQAALFLGAWNSPFGSADPIYLALGYDPVAAGGAYFAGELTGPMSATATANAMGMDSAANMFLLNLYGAFWLCLKATVMIFIQIWIRWTLPRIRIDQVLHTCVKVLLPASMVMLLAAALWVLLVPQPAVTIQASRIVDTANDTIYVGAGHGLTTGDAVTYKNGGANSIGGLTDGDTYFVNVVDSAAVKLYDNEADAIAGGETGLKVLTSSGTGANHALSRPGAELTFNPNPVELPFLSLAEGHGLRTGFAVNYNKSSDAADTGLTEGRSYFVIMLDDRRAHLADSHQNALSGLAMTLPADGVSGDDVLTHRASHLVSPTPGLQLATQIVLSFLGVAACVLVIGFCLLGWVGVIRNDKNQPPKSLFAEAMPVGRDIAFMRGDEGKPAAGNGEAGTGDGKPAVV